MGFARKRNIFVVFLGLSLAWHLLGAATIGIVQEPKPSFAQVAAPVLALRTPVEMLSVGWDARTGMRVLRPVADFHDPEYFGFPRRWDKRRFEPVHVPSVSQEIPVPEPWRVSGYSLELSEQAQRVRVWLPPVADPLQLAEILERGRLQTSAVSQGCSSLQLIVHGPLADRKCLVRIIPDLDAVQMARIHSLVLGEKKVPQGPNGLVLRIWVAPDGAVREAFVESSSGNADVDAKILRSVQQWVFEGFAAPFDAYQWGCITLEERAKP